MVTIFFADGKNFPKTKFVKNGKEVMLTPKNVKIEASLWRIRVHSPHGFSSVWNGFSAVHSNFRVQEKTSRAAAAGSPGDDGYADERPDF